jgi:hypothetical protein
VETDQVSPDQAIRLIKTSVETIMVRLLVALADGKVLDEEFPNHELEDLQIMVQETNDELIIRVEIEDQKSNLIYQYKRKQTYAY